MQTKSKISIFWFRRDLRLTNNRGLYEALKGEYPVLPVFIFDLAILNQFEKGENAQVQFILNEVRDLKQRLVEYGSSIQVFHTTPPLAFEKLLEGYDVQAVYTNEDYELSAIQRDNGIINLLKEKSIPFYSYKDHVIFSKDDILKEDRSPYTVFTPYSKRWRQTLTENDLQLFDSENHLNNLYQTANSSSITLYDLGFKERKIELPNNNISESILEKYDKQRDFPALRGTTRLGIHLRFGTISIRDLVKSALKLNDTFLNELIWRDFYHSITYHFPHICESKAFKPQYDNIKWINNEEQFRAWCEGKTGYPIVDAGMRELNATGFMHNRVRMITASFLIKHLLIDWRWGEAYFANKLIDFDFAANNGGWQWAASSGCDAVPYFRIFNPELQTDKFDKNHQYIKKWIPEYVPATYIKPIIEHKFARERAIDTYKNALKRE